MGGRGGHTPIRKEPCRGTQIPRRLAPERPCGTTCAQEWGPPRAHRPGGPGRPDFWTFLGKGESSAGTWTRAGGALPAGQPRLWESPSLGLPAAPRPRSLWARTWAREQPWAPCHRAASSCPTRLSAPDGQVPTRKTLLWGLRLAPTCCVPRDTSPPCFGAGRPHL